MSHHKWLLVIALVCPVQMCSQGQPSAHVLFAGCYRVVSLAWQPPDEDIKLIPERFQLRSEPAFESSKEMFAVRDRKSTRLNSSHVAISYAVFCLKKKTGSYSAAEES